MEKFESDNWKMWIEGDIAYVIYLAEHITYDIVEEGIKRRLEMTKDKSYLMFSDIRKIKSMTREGRQRMAQKDAGYGTIAAAILSNSKVQEVIFNFFNAIYKSPAPAKMFTDEKKAIAWLQQFNIRTE